MSAITERVANSLSLPLSHQSTALQSSPPLAVQPSNTPPEALNMKDVSVTSTRASRNPLYPKKRPSPLRDSGVQKSRYRDLPNATRRTPAMIKAELHKQRQREAQLAAFRKEGIYVEDEYREEICFYMRQMEVSHSKYQG